MAGNSIENNSPKENHTSVNTLKEAIGKKQTNKKPMKAEHRSTKFSKAEVEENSTTAAELTTTDKKK